MKKLNCWEFMGCGRQPGGEKASKLGVCPAATEVRLNGANGGINAGRACWIVAGTMCKGRVQGTFAMKIGNCEACGFYNLVKIEEGEALNPTFGLLNRIS